MSSTHSRHLRLLLAALLFVNVSLALADGRGDNNHRDGHSDRGDNHQWDGRQDRGGHDNNHFDQRYHHDRYYPSPGVVVDRVPRGHVVVPYHNDRYYFGGGAWYRPQGSRFVVVTPPIGLSVSILPPYYTTLWVGGMPYYYADGVYYAWRPVERTYIVVEPPREPDLSNPPPQPDQWYIYPKAGQSEQRQASDRYECHRWAVGQTGFDPTQPGAGNFPPSQYDMRRADYQRATKACLEGRGYSVR